MVIEWLQFRVQEDLREQFVRLDEEIWTAALSQYDGFLGKEVWISAEDLAEVIAVIRWENSESWYAIPDSELQKVDTQFNEAMGEETFELVSSKAYQVRKFVS
jgi:uncharacterized protein (TIGR03792 family)